VHGDFRKQADTLRGQATPLYQAAYYEADGVTPRGLISPKLEELAKTPVVRSALARAIRIAGNEGVDPTTIGLIPKTYELPGPNGPMHVVGDVKIEKPTVKTWDYIKRAIGDDIYERGRNKLTNRLELDDEGRSQMKVLNELRQELFDRSPAYKLAVQKGGEPLALEEAYQAVPDLMRRAVSEDQFATRVKNYTPAQQEALKGGLIGYIHDAARSGRLRLQDMQQPAFKTKIETILGKDKATEFLHLVEHEIGLAKTGGRMMPGVGSITSEAQMAGAEQNEALQRLAETMSKASKGKWLDIVMGHIKGVAAGVQTPIDQATRDEVGRLLMLPPDQLAGALETYQKSAGAKRTAADLVAKITQDPALASLARRAALSEGADLAEPAADQQE